MAVSKEDILESISSMSVMDVVELVEAMEEKFGVSAASVAAATDKMTKGAVMGDALSQLLSLDSKLSDPEDKAILKAAVESILGIKFRFEIPNQLDNQES